MENECKLNSVEEMFRWKLSKEYLAEYELEKIEFPTVEEANARWIKQEAGGYGQSLQWEHSDVLYSFVMTYYLGLRTINEKRFEELFKAETQTQNNPNLRRNSTKFLFKCSRDPVFKELNESKEMVEFIKLYFSIGNVIPMWPGGNEARGKKGIYDIPELFFNLYPYWTQALIEKYPNAHLDLVVNNTDFCVYRKGEGDQVCEVRYINAYENLKKFEKDVLGDSRVYYDHLLRRIDIIREREEKILKGIKASMVII